VRSLLGGGVATGLDLTTGITLLALGAPTRVADMSGNLVGAIFNYVWNRTVAFKDTSQGLGGSALRYVLVTLGTIAVHGQVAVYFHDVRGLAYPVAKILSDLVVLVSTQLLWRYVVFPRAKAAKVPAE